MKCELDSLEGFSDRFWYWHGKSGARYIHSIYTPDACPPLPGAIFVTVQKLSNGKRVAIEVGRFCHDWDYVESLIADHKAGFSNVDEIHVHLLAQTNDNADDVVDDILAGIGPRLVCGRQQHQKPQQIFAKTAKWQPGLFDGQASNVLASA